MALTIARGPFGQAPAGRLNFPVPDRVVLVEPLGRRLRATKDGATVVDSDAVQLVHVSGDLPRYAIPASDVRVAAKPHPDVEGHVLVEWDAVDAWFEEDERVYVHPLDPYHRVDTFASSRRVQVRIAGTIVADSTRARALHETSLPVRWYLPRVDIDFSHLERTRTVTECPYKGTAHYWSTRVGDTVVEDVVWSYEEDIRRDAVPVQWMLCFYGERPDVDMTVG